VTRDLAVQARLQPIGPVSVSAGVASLPDHGASAIALLRAADRALYRAKGNGRNRVCVAEVNASGASNTPNVPFGRFREPGGGSEPTSSALSRAGRPDSPRSSEARPCSEDAHRSRRLVRYPVRYCSFAVSEPAVRRDRNIVSWSAS
jgi:hypothetical protein